MLAATLLLGLAAVVGCARGGSRSEPTPQTTPDTPTPIETVRYAPTLEELQKEIETAYATIGSQVPRSITSALMVCNGDVGGPTDIEPVSYRMRAGCGGIGDQLKLDFLETGNELLRDALFSTRDFSFSQLDQMKAQGQVPGIIDVEAYKDLLAVDHFSLSNQ